MFAIAICLTVSVALMCQIPSEQRMPTIRAEDRSGVPDWCGKAILPHLLERLERGNPRERMDAALELGILGEAEPPLIAALSRAANDADTSAAVTAVTAIGRIGRPASAAAHALAQVLGDKRYSGSSLGYETDSAGLRSGPSPVAHALAAIGEASVPVLVRTLRDGPSENSREEAAFALELLGPQARSAVSALIEAIQDKDLFVRRRAAKALGRIGPEAKEAVPFLEAALGDEHNYQHTLLALEKLEGKGRKLLQTAIREKRHSEVAFLSELGIKADGAVPSLIEALKANDYDVRVEAFSGLGRNGPAAAQAVPAMIDYLKSKRGVDCSEAFELSRIGDAARPAIRLMFELVGSSSPEDLGDVARACVQIDPYGVESVAPLVEATGKGNLPTSVAIEIHNALGEIGPAAAAAVPALLESLKRGREAMTKRSKDPNEFEEPNDSGYKLRWAVASALEALGRIGPPAAAAVPTLVGALQSDDGWARLEAIKALGEIGAASVAAVPRLLDVVARHRGASKSADLIERRAAVQALGRIGPAASVAAPFLSDLLKYGVPFEPETVWAIARIEHGLSDEVRREVEKRMRTFPQSLQCRLEVSAALGKNCPELERYKRLLVDQLERDLSAVSENESGPWIEFVASDLRRLTVFGRGSAEVFRSLFKLRDHPQPLVRRWIREAITRIRGQ
jgi:HEAT repeat protein